MSADYWYMYKNKTKNRNKNNQRNVEQKIAFII